MENQFGPSRNAGVGIASSLRSQKKRMRAASTPATLLARLCLSFLTAICLHSVTAEAVPVVLSFDEGAEGVIVVDGTDHNGLHGVVTVSGEQVTVCGNRPLRTDCALSNFSGIGGFQSGVVNILEVGSSVISDQIQFSYRVDPKGSPAITFVSDPAQFLVGQTVLATVEETGFHQLVYQYVGDSTTSPLVSIYVTSDVDAVPLPGTALLLGIGLAGLGLSRRRKA